VIGVALDWKVHFCARHLEPFRARWPRGAAIIGVTLFQEASARPEISERCRSIDGLDAVLREFSPLCCLVGDETMARLTAAALKR